MNKVLLIEPVLAHYRKDVFQTFFDSEDFNFEIIAGRSYQGIQSLDYRNSIFDYTALKVFSHTFYYLKGSVKYALSKKPDVIICTGVDFHLLHTIILFFIYRIILRKRFYWWSHAATGHQRKFGFLIRKFFYRSSNGIFSYNRAGKENLLLMGVKDQKIVVVNNSINKEDYGYLNHDLNNKTTGNVFTILYCGRVTKSKKIDILIQALGVLRKKNVFDFKCFIIGDGDLEEIIKLAKELNILEKIDFVGAKYGKQAHPYFLDSDLFVYPGGIGLSALHSLSFGIPVITTDNLSLHFPEFELIKPGFNGDLFTDNSFEDLANKIVEWRNNLTKSREKYINNCIQQINELGYLPDIMSFKILDFLRSELSI
jgi:glycosyltransferase involved in cell wall biosynthesis